MYIYCLYNAKNITRKLADMNFFVIYLDFHSTKRALWLVESWSRSPDKIQTNPDRDTIPESLPASDVLLRLLKEKPKYITKHLTYGPLGN